MNDGLPTFREGFAIAPQITARAMNAMVAAIRRNRVTPGPNQLLDQSNGGTQVWERRRRAPGVLSATPGALTLTTTPPVAWVDPGTPNRQYAFVTFGTWDGFIVEGLDDFVVEIDTTSVAALDRRIYLKASWTPPLTIDLGAGVVPNWTSVELLEAATLPAQGTIDPVTGFRGYYILSIGRVRWQSVSGVWQRILSSDDTGSIRSGLDISSGAASATAGPDVAPVRPVTGTWRFYRNSASI